MVNIYFGPQSSMKSCATKQNRHRWEDILRDGDAGTHCKDLTLVWTEHLPDFLPLLLHVEDILHDLTVLCCLHVQEAIICEETRDRCDVLWHVVDVCRTEDGRIPKDVLYGEVVSGAKLCRSGMLASETKFA